MAIPKVKQDSFFFFIIGLRSRGKGVGEGPKKEALSMPVCMYVCMCV